MTPHWWTPPWEQGSDADPEAGWSPSDANSESELGRGVTDPEGVLARALHTDVSQVRSRDRVRDLAEVFTHQREIDAMLDMMPDAFAYLDVKFLEPTCGAGNFLVEILRRKLCLVTHADCVSQEQYEHRLLRALASVYGIDISHENITEARGRMAHVLLDHFETDANTLTPTQGFLLAASLILSINVVQGDTLKAADQIEMCDWQPRLAGRFQRLWSYALVPEHERDLFWEERLEDVQPIHYSQLAPVDLRAKPRRVKQ